MSEVIMREFVKAITDLTAAQQKTQDMIKNLPDYSGALEKTNQRADAIQKEIAGIPGRISLPESTIKALAHELLEHRLQLQQPLKQDVQHHHHVGWTVSIGLFLLAVALTLAYWLSITLHDKTVQTVYETVNPDVRVFTIEHRVEIERYLDSTYKAHAKRSMSKNNSHILQ